MSDDVNDFLMGGGAKAFPFDNLGDMCEGEIVSMTKRQQTSLDSGKPQYWDNGEPKMMVVVVVQTTLSIDDEDDGLRSVYLRGGNFDVASGVGHSSAKAVRDAVKRAGAAGIEVGGRLALKWTGLAPKKGGFSPAKLYSATYKPASAMIPADEMG
jgi:hypothetical protein